MPERKPVIPAGAAPNPALSAGVIVGDLLFVSGHVAMDNSGNVVGEGDAEAAGIYAAAYGKDPEFYAFVRSLEAYRNTLGTGTTMVVPPDHEFFRYLDPSKKPAKGSSGAPVSTAGH